MSNAKCQMTNRHRLSNCKAGIYPVIFQSLTRREGFGILTLVIGNYAE